MTFADQFGIVIDARAKLGMVLARLAADREECQNVMRTVDAYFIPDAPTSIGDASAILHAVLRRYEITIAELEQVNDLYGRWITQTWGTTR